MFRTLGLLTISYVIVAGRIQAQATYEVASIKLAQSQRQGQQIINPTTTGKLVVRNCTLRALLQWAFFVPDFRIVGGPSWVSSTKYDVEARAATKAEGYTFEQIQQMIQSLLAERFNLKVRHETRTLPIFVLKVAQGGAKLKETSDSECSDPSIPLSLESTTPPCGAIRMGMGVLFGSGVTMPILAQSLQRRFETVVLDETGLSDRKYNIKLAWNPDAAQNQPGTNIADSTGTAISNQASSIITDGLLFNAVREQLGLDLSSRKGPVDVIVIDHAEPPSEN